MKWLATNAPASMNDLEIIFPATGDSFMPVGSVVGLRERKIRNNHKILCKEEHLDSFKFAYKRQKNVERTS